MSQGPPESGPWLDGDAGRMVRPYTVSNGRTKPSADFDLLTMVMATDRHPNPNRYLGPEHAQALKLCTGPMTVAEIAAHIGQPAVVAKVLLSDLVDCGAVIAHAPAAAPEGPDSIGIDVLEAVLDGLRKQL